MNMDNWGMTSYRLARTVVEEKVSERRLPNYDGELAVSFPDFGDVNLAESSLYFKAPEAYLKNQIFSYGGKISYMLTYSGYELESKSFCLTHLFRLTYFSLIGFVSICFAPSLMLFLYSNDPAR